MLPSRISSDVTSSAEKKVFDWLCNDPCTDGWIVLHSLGLSHHETLLFGEIDFVVLAPGLGIFCLEVKGGRVSRENGYWTFTNRYGKTNRKARGPFDQAREGMFSLINELKKRLPKDIPITNLLFGYGVIFPDIVFDVCDPDYDLVQVWDRRAIEQSSISIFIKRLSSYTQTNQVRIYGNTKRREYPSRQQVKAIADALRGDFDRPMLLSTRLEEAERKLDQMTREQFRVLDMFRDNPRLVVEGTAGTGKTLLAVEMTRRALENGERVALFCFNAKLGDWLKGRFEGMNTKDSFIGTFHAFMLSKVRGRPHEPSSRYFTDELPSKLLEAIGQEGAKFDRIIVDEAQDLIRDAYLLVFDGILRNGFDEGRWTMFGDFGEQAIYQLGQTREGLLASVDDFATNARARLTVNCRNTRNIGDTAQLICGVESAYPADAVKGPPVTYVQWETEADEIDELSNQIRKTLAEGVSANDIAILSTRAIDESVASAVIPSIAASSSGFAIPAYSIASFKGLESKVIMLVDCDSYANLSLYYVGITRARVMLYIFESSRARKQRGRLMMGQFNG